MQGIKIDEFAECYLEARRNEAKETNLEPGIFPLICPFSIEDVFRS